jgi:signal transduction histidine kinase
MLLVEITRSLNLTLKDCARTDLHSLLNVLNVFYEELERLGQAYDNPHLRAGAESCLQLLSLMGESPEVAMESFAIDLDLLAHHIRQLGMESPRAQSDARVLASILAILTDRVEEMRLDRMAWREITAEELAGNLARFLDTTAVASRGRFRIIEAGEGIPPEGYALDLRIDAPGDRLRAPLIFEDVLRDLVANARKYTSAPARIEVRLNVSPAGELDLMVSDHGIGIPAGEVERVVEMGYRASNVTGRRTLGGGFGLTKAYLVAKGFGGSFWIGSVEGEGTTIRLTLRPPGNEGGGDVAGPPPRLGA